MLLYATVTTSTDFQYDTRYDNSPIYFIISFIEMRYIICNADIGVQIRYVHSAYMLYKYTYYSMIWVYAMHYAYRLWLSTNILFRFCARPRPIYQFVQFRTSLFVL